MVSPAAQARNATAPGKEADRRRTFEAFVQRFDIPIPFMRSAKKGKFYRPAPDSPEIVYLQEAAVRQLGGYMPSGRDAKPQSSFKAPDLDFFAEWTAGSKGPRRLDHHGALSACCATSHERQRDWQADRPRPSFPDEGRTFGLGIGDDRQVGIYAPEGQKYKPHDVDMLLFYREEKDGQILEEGITEAGSMASFTAAQALRAYSNLSACAMIPFYMYYCDVRLPACRRHDLGLRRLARPGFLMGRHGGPHPPCSATRPAARRTATAMCSRGTVPNCAIPATILPTSTRLARDPCRTASRRMYQRWRKRLLLHHHV